MDRKLLKSLTGFSLALDIMILDQLTKWLILEHALKGRSGLTDSPQDLLSWIAAAPQRLGPASIEILPFFNLTMVWNHGVSFGMFQSDTPYFLIGLALLISGVFAVWLARATGWAQALALGAVIGGAMGNVIDRLRFGAVADFFDFHVAGWHYPAFNVADAGITVGIAILIADSVWLEPRRRKSGDSE